MFIMFLIISVLLALPVSRLLVGALMGNSYNNLKVLFSSLFKGDLVWLKHDKNEQLLLQENPIFLLLFYCSTSCRYTKH